jgi:hypothetical protein
MAVSLFLGRVRYSRGLEVIMKAGFMQRDGGYSKQFSR